MTQFTANHTPAQIVKMFPKASDLFKVRRIDFCCGGDRRLADTFRDKNIDGSPVLNELNASYEEWCKEDHTVTDWDSMPPTQLVDHIVQHHHGYLNEELPALGPFVTKILRVHGANHPHLKELHRFFNDFKAEMEEHMIQEESEVFPLIKEYEHNPSEALRNKIHEANGGLEDEHESAGNLLKQMREITDGFEPPKDACTSYRITYARLAQMESDTYQHVHLENNILFKNL